MVEQGLRAGSRKCRNDQQIRCLDMLKWLGRHDEVGDSLPRDGNDLLSGCLGTRAR